MNDQSQSHSFCLLFESALQDYQNQTGTHLANHPLTENFRNCNSVNSITALLQEQACAISEFRGGNGKYMNSIKRVVCILYTLSATIGEANSLSFPPAQAVFTSFAILLATVKDVGSSYDATRVVDLLELIEHFMNRLDIYTRVPLTSSMTEIVVKMMVELLSTLALVTRQIKQRRPIKLVKKLLGENEVEAVLERLDRLTLDEAQTTAAQTLEVVYGLVQNTRVVMDDGKAHLELIQQVVGNMNKSKREKSFEDIRSWLSPPDPWINHNVACKLRHAGSAAWFVQGNVFSEWKSSGLSSLLWIHGKPGAGKSVLFSSAIQDIYGMRKSELASLAFFYCDFREDEKKDLRGLLSSLLVQLCHQSDTYCDILFNLYSTHANGSQHPSDDALINCLNEILKLPGQAPVYLFLDALDECPSSSALPSPREDVLQLLEELIDSQIPNLFICVTSRPETDIKAILDPLTFRSISLHDEVGQIEDIRNYIRFVVNTDQTMRRWKAADKQLVIDVLTKRADGMFRWVYCQLVHIRHCLPGRIRNVLDELPETLDETYERILRDIDKANWELAHRLLQCVTVASRPLRVEELAEFLAFDFTAGPIPKYYEGWLLEDPVHAVLSTTSALLVVVDVDGSQVIQFSHFSVKEFLTSSRLAGSSDVITRRYHISTTCAHTLTAQACLGMLLHMDKDITRDELERFPFVEYAAKHWVDHAQFDHVARRVEDGMKRLFDPTKAHLSVWVWLYDSEDLYWRRDKRGERPSQPRGTALHYAALSGFDMIVKYLLVEKSQDVDSRGFNHKWTPLHLASRKGHCGVACVLLDQGADATAEDKDGSTPLHLASRWGHGAMVSVLLDRGGDAKARDKQGRISFQLAAIGGHVEVACVFLERSVDAVAEVIQGWTPLHRASFEGDTEVTYILLEGGADVTTQDDGGLTPLHAASLGGNVEVVRLLLGRGADVTAQGEGGWTPLYAASLGGHVEVIHVLLGFGADVEGQQEDGLTPLHVASVQGHYKAVGVLLAHGADVTARHDNGFTPLHLAAFDGHVNVAHALLDHGAGVTAQDKDGWTPLHVASQEGHVEVARLLFERDADVTAQDNDKWTPLHAASQEGQMEVAHLLLEHGADTTAQDDLGQTPLHLTSQEGHVEVARLLLEHGTDATAQANNGFTPLHVASQEGHIEVARLLLKFSADVTAQATNKQTPLHLALALGHAEVALLLLESGADMTARDEDGFTPLHAAAQGGHVEVTQILIDRGANATTQANYGQSPLHIASFWGHAEVACFLLECGADATAQESNSFTALHAASQEGHVDVARLLLEHGAAVTAQANNGFTPLHAASREGHVEVACLLLNFSADVTAQATNKQTPLHLALALGHADVALLLLESGADVTARDEDDFTPLHAAAQGGNAEVTLILIDLGASPTARANYGQSPLQIASFWGHVEVARFLLERGADATAQENYGFTALHAASQEGHIEVACLLLEHGADVTAQASDGRTPLGMALQGEHVELARVLLEHEIAHRPRKPE